MQIERLSTDDIDTITKIAGPMLMHYEYQIDRNLALTFSKPSLEKKLTTDL